MRQNTSNARKILMLVLMNEHHAHNPMSKMNRRRSERGHVDEETSHRHGLPYVVLWVSASPAEVEGIIGSGFSFPASISSLPSESWPSWLEGTEVPFPPCSVSWGFGLHGSTSGEFSLSSRHTCVHCLKQSMHSVKYSSPALERGFSSLWSSLPRSSSTSSTWPRSSPLPSSLSPCLRCSLLWHWFICSKVMSSQQNIAEIKVWLPCFLCWFLSTLLAGTPVLSKVIPCWSAAHKDFFSLCDRFNNLGKSNYWGKFSRVREAWMQMVCSPSNAGDHGFAQIQHCSTLDCSCGSQNESPGWGLGLSRKIRTHPQEQIHLSSYPNDREQAPCLSQDPLFLTYKWGTEALKALQVVANSVVAGCHNFGLVRTSKENILRTKFSWFNDALQGDEVREAMRSQSVARSMWIQRALLTLSLSAISNQMIPCMRRCSLGKMCLSMSYMK